MTFDQLPPQEAIERDHQLEAEAERTSNALAEHRWHWTLNESNVERVSIRAYARAVGRSASTIGNYANGYLTWRDRAGAITSSESIERAKVGTEKETAISAVAEARGLSFKHVRQSRPEEVRRVRELARERAEEKGTSIEEEAPKVAAIIAKVDEAEIARRDERMQRHGLRYIELEGYFTSALRFLARAERLAGQLQWEEEEQELLTHSIEQIRKLLHRIDQRIAGVETIDWDAELEAILSEAGS